MCEVWTVSVRQIACRFPSDRVPVQRGLPDDVARSARAGGGMPPRLLALATVGEASLVCMVAVYFMLTSCGGCLLELWRSRRGGPGIRKILSGCVLFRSGHAARDTLSARTGGDFGVQMGLCACMLAAALVVLDRSQHKRGGGDQWC